MHNSMQIMHSLSNNHAVEAAINRLLFCTNIYIWFCCYYAIDNVFNSKILLDVKRLSWSTAIAIHFGWRIYHRDYK